ncbi:transcriptional regulator [Nitratireductor mangrovi]|uniref:Transcriptional regulator n=1 Tax=Nitratireductor mangrovi TaxID=2599600 RepID=A0A5B8KU10_9HYPH|nr:helix-turn-helix domain-containing protein [Nitratireductor mangrovi]QDY99095.2 transcriptional regulator [Nitratireductor mangrovi]
MDPIQRSAKIRDALYVRGLKFKDIDEHFRLPTGTAWRTMREPNPKGEAALCEVLDMAPTALWPERYDADGERLNPQPLSNYKSLPTMSERRRKVRAA